MTGLLVNLGIALALGTTMESMWNLLHIIQLLNFLPLINVRVPPNMKLLFEILGFANMDVKLITMAFEKGFID